MNDETTTASVAERSALKPAWAIFDVDEAIGRTKVLAFLPGKEVSCQCLDCGKPFKRTVQSMNASKRERRDSSCKRCRPKRLKKGMASPFSRRPPKLEVSP